MSQKQLCISVFISSSFSFFFLSSVFFKEQVSSEYREDLWNAPWTNITLSFQGVDTAKQQSHYSMKLRRKLRLANLAQSTAQNKEVSCKAS